MAKNFDDATLRPETPETTDISPTSGHSRGWELLRSSEGKVGLKKMEEKQIGGFPMSRREPKDLGGLMGRCVRSPITGEVHLKSSPSQQEHGDFQVIDLFTRRRLGGGVEALSTDKYLFKPVPLLYRTWIYHFLYNAGKVVTGDSAMDQDAMVKHVLSYKCIDRPTVSAGRWSPSMVYVPLSLASTLTNDYALVGFTTFVLVILFGISYCMNTPDTYRYGRLGTTALRVIYLLGLLIWLGSSSFDDGVAILGWLVVFGLCAADLFVGDVAMATCYWMHCQYDVVRCLPNRVFVCRRTGAAGTQLPGAKTEKIDEKVTGMGRWDPTYSLIMDLQGLLVELLPMTLLDWEALSDTFRMTSKPPYYVGIDAYNDENPSPPPMLLEELAEKTPLASGPQPTKKRPNTPTAWVMQNMD